MLSGDLGRAGAKAARVFLVVGGKKDALHFPRSELDQAQVLPEAVQDSHASLKGPLTIK